MATLERRVDLLYTRPSTGVDPTLINLLDDIRREMRDGFEEVNRGFTEVRRRLDQTATKDDIAKLKEMIAKLTPPAG